MLLHMASSSEVQLEQLAVWLLSNVCHSLSNHGDIFISRMEQRFGHLGL
jgi:hypothetical protein